MSTEPVVEPIDEAKVLVIYPEQTVSQMLVVNQVEQWLIDKDEKYSQIPDVGTPEGMELAREYRRDCVSTRTTMEAAKLLATEPLRTEVTRINKLVKEDYKPRILALEEPLDKAIKNEEKRKAEEKAEKERIEAARIAAIHKAIDNIKATHYAVTLEEINTALLQLTDVDMAPFEELADNAQIHIDYAVDSLTQRKDTLEEQAAEKARLAEVEKEQKLEAKRLKDEKAANEKAETKRKADQKKEDDEREARIKAEDESIAKRKKQVAEEEESIAKRRQLAGSSTLDSTAAHNPVEKDEIAPGKKAGRARVKVKDQQLEARAADLELFGEWLIDLKIAEVAMGNIVATSEKGQYTQEAIQEHLGQILNLVSDLEASLSVGSK